MTEKYDKYKEFVNVPQRLVKKGFQALKDWHPENKWWQFARVPAAAVAFNLHLALWLFTRVGLDNPIIEKLDDLNTNKNVEESAKTKFGRFIAKIRKQEKRRPTLAAILMYYLMLSMLVGAGQVYKNKEKKKETVKEWHMDEKDDANEDAVDEAQKNTFAAYQEELQPITPWLIAELIAAEGVHMEKGMHTPYKDSKGIWTIGFGSTRLKDGRRVTKNTPPITTAEAYDLARWHLEEKETFFYLYCYSVADKKLAVRNTGEAFGLASIIYNSGTKVIEDAKDKNANERFALLRKEYKKYGVALPDSVVMQLFEKYPIQNKKSFGSAWIDSNKPQDMANAIGLYMADGGGMHWRRWLEAGLITGDISPEDLLECPIKGMYDFYIYAGGGTKQQGKYALWENTKNGLTPKKSTYTLFKEWLKNPQQKDVKTGQLTLIKRPKVKDYLPAEILQECMNGICEIGAKPQRTKTDEQIDKQTYVIGYEDLYVSAISNYRSGNYDTAIEIMESLVKDNPQNALLHNDLALFYNKIGDYDKAIKHTKIVLDEIGDKSQYAAALYNQGVAYEHQGQLQQALSSYKLALANGNKDASGAISRVNRAISKQKSKKTAFDSGTMKLKQKYQNNNMISSSYTKYHA